MNTEFSHTGPVTGLVGAEVFLTLVKECSRLLRTAVPDDFAPEAPRPLPVPSAEVLRRLGAPSLGDFYALAMESNHAAAPKTLALFPHGPESIKPAQIALEREIARLKAAREKTSSEKSEKITRRLKILRQSRTRLALASRLWPKIKKEALLWPEEAGKLRRMAARLDEGVGRVLKVFQAGGEEEGDEDFPNPRCRASLTRAAADLKRELDAALRVINEKNRLSALLAGFSGEMEGLLAAASEDLEAARDWGAVEREAEKRYKFLRQEAARLNTDAANIHDSLTQSLEFLAEAEVRSSARKDGAILRERLEAALRGVDALMASAFDRRRQLAGLYFALPPRLGRPIFLEKTHLVTAAALGRTQMALEETRRRVALALGRLSSTHKLRKDGAKAVDSLAIVSDHAELLSRGERRLAALGRAIGQRLTLRRVISQSAETETELSRTLLDNERLTRHLKNAALESERLAEELSVARRALGDLGKIKARLLKLYGQKNLLLEDAETSRQKLMRENAELRAAKAELKRKRARLASMYKLENDDLKRLSKEFNEERERMGLNQDLMEARETERRDLEQRLESTREARDTLAAEQRDLEAKTSSLAENLADALTRAETLLAESNRLGEKLAGVSRVRLKLSERLAAMQRKGGRLAQAQAALRKNVQRKAARMEAAEEERDSAQAKLTRQNKNILRLVGQRQQLRADLGRTTLRLADLEKEKNELFAQLSEARVKADETEKASEILKTRVGGLESENERLAGRAVELGGELVKLTGDKLSLEEKQAGLRGQLDELKSHLENDLTPLIHIMGQALRFSETARQDTGKRLEQAGMMMKDMRLSFDVREANIRLKAAARELDIGEAAHGECQALSRNLDKKAGELAAAQSQVSELAAQLTAFKSDSDQMYQRDQDIRTSVAHLGHRNSKLRAALTAMKDRYGGRLDEAKSTELGLRDLIDSQNRELKRQKRRLGELEPLVTYFLDQAETNFKNAVDQAALRQLKGEAGQLREASGSSTPHLNRLLLTRLAELQPLVAFLAKSFVAAVADLAQARTEREVLAGQLKQANSQQEVLAGNLDSRHGEFLEVRSQAFELTRERDQLQGALAEKDSEILLLKNELAEADRDLAENDGRLEAAWAGLNYLNSKSGDSLDKMKVQLENQTRQSDKLSKELEKRNARIKDLEERQNQLALLYWALVSKAADEISPLEEFVPAVLPEILPEPDAEEPRQEERGGSGHFFLAAKKAARGAFFTFLLAGGLVMGRASAGALDNAQPETAQLSATIDSSLLGRPVSLDFVESSVRLKGQAAVEGRLKEKVREVAGEHSLTPHEFLRLVRQASPPEEALYLNDFEGPAGAVTLLARQTPRLAASLSGASGDIVGLLKASASFKPGEGLFWERIYFNMAEEFSPEKSLAALVKLLQRKEALATRPQPEFAGRLAPFPDVDNMAAPSFISFMGPHIRHNWPLPAGRGQAALSRRLAGDLFFSARIYKLPLSVFSAALQWEAEHGQGTALFETRLATIFMYKKAAELAELAVTGGEIWQNGRAPLCDLDEILAKKHGSGGMENIFRKRMKIIMAYNKMTSSSQNLFSRKEFA